MGLTYLDLSTSTYWLWDIVYPDILSSMIADSSHSGPGINFAVRAPGKCGDETSMTTLEKSRRYNKARKRREC